MNGIFNARIVFAEALRASDVVGPVSVESNGWVTLWRAESPEYVEAMYPPQSVLLVAAAPQTIEPRPRLTSCDDCAEYSPGETCERCGRVQASPSTAQEPRG